ncbi:uncharacterized protein [Rutidosis leptorrhynchoides]|uniref:uncharacterized protein n=1 Tax=Rutidosis leptorrhynchoides TaxID=125765 RepID=UPI003A992805
MSPEKVTKMVLDVDLKCSDCYKKVKKAINKFAEIRDQEYDVEKNKVKITVVSCCPDKIRDKLHYKGGTSIQKMEIVVDKPKEPVAANKLKTKPKNEESETPKDNNNPKTQPPAKKLEVAKMTFEPPVQGYPQMYPPATYPMVGYGYESGPSVGSIAQPHSSGYGYEYGPGYNHGYMGNSSHFASSDYFSEENPQGCSIM